MSCPSILRDGAAGCVTTRLRIDVWRATRTRTVWSLQQAVQVTPPGQSGASSHRRPTSLVHRSPSMTLTANIAGSPPKKAADAANESARDFGLRFGDPLTALGPLHVSGGKEETRPDLFGGDLQLGAVLTVLRLPAALVQAARDDHPHALGEGKGYVLGQIPPAHDVLWISSFGVLPTSLTLRRGRCE